MRSKSALSPANWHPRRATVAKVAAVCLATCQGTREAACQRLQTQPATATHQAASVPDRRTPTPADRGAMATALAEYNAGRVAEAKPVLVRLANTYTANATLQAAAGMASVECGDLEDGTRYLQHAHTLNTGDVGVEENLGIALLRLGRPAEALPLLQHARRAEPDNTAAYVSEAQAHVALSHYAEAADLYSTAAQRPTAPAAIDSFRQDWAFALVAANRPQQAIDVLHADAATSSTAASQELLGEAEEKLGHYQAAFTSFKRAAELDPSESNLLAYGNELLRHWTFPAAIEIFQYGHARFPESSPLLTGLGVAYFGNNDFAHAAEVFHAQLVAQPENATAADLLGRSCSAVTGAQATGCDDLVHFAQAHPRNASASLYAAISLLRAQADTASTAQAVTLLQQALAVDPRLAEAWYQLAVAQQYSAQWADSAGSLEHALVLRPAFAEAHYRLARAYGHLGRKEDAAHQIALQQQFASEAKAFDNRRMQEVMTFLTTTN